MVRMSLKNSLLKQQQPNQTKTFFIILFYPPPELIPVLGPLNSDMMPPLDEALLCSSRAGSDLGCVSRLA